MKRAIQSIKFSLRQCIKTPTNTVLCILVLAGSIALASAMFRLYYMTFLWEYPYKNADKIVQLQRVDDNGGTHSEWTFKTVDQLTEGDNHELFSAFIPVFKNILTVRIGENGYSTNCAYIACDFGKTFGIKPLIGRTFTKTDAQSGAVPVILLSEKYWRDLFKASKDVIGKTILCDKVERTIVGVMPSSFDFPTTLSTGACGVWLPFSESIIKRDKDWINYSNLYAVVRPGTSISSAEKRFSEIVRLVAKALPDDNKGTAGGALEKINGNYTPAGFQTMIRASSMCSLLVLFMGCCIVSSLLTARYSLRVRELAIKTAIGASRRQIIGQMLAEFTVISSTSVVLGLLLNEFLERGIFAQYYDMFGLPEYAQGVSILWTSGFVAAVLCVVTLVSSILPALRASVTDLTAVMRDSTRTGSSLRITRLSNFLIASQVAMAGVILFCGMMIGFKIYKLHHEEKFYNPYNYLCALVSMDSNASGEERNNICQKILRELRANPQIEKAALSTEVFNTATFQWGSDTKVWIDGQSYEDEAQVPHVMFRVVSPGYFNSINVPLMSGHDFSDEDNDPQIHNAAVTDVFALKYFGTMDVLGKGFRMWGKNGTLYKIIAVVPDLYNSREKPELMTGFFISYAANPWNNVPIFLKGHGEPEQYETVLRDAIGHADSRAVISRLMNMGVMKDYHGWGLILELVFTFFSAFAVSALILAGAGLYGVISFSANMRRKEMGIRLALGASPLGLALHVAKRGLAFVAIGLAAGSMGSVLVRYALTKNAYQIYDGWEVYALAFLSMLIISLVAIIIPAARGSTMEPASALRED